MKVFAVVPSYVKASVVGWLKRLEGKLQPLFLYWRRLAVSSLVLSVTRTKKSLFEYMPMAKPRS